MAECQDCILYKSATSPCMPCEGGTLGGLMLVGEAPGAVEDQQNRPFVGDAGRLLERVLTRLGLSRADVIFSNACRCRPPGNKTPNAAEIVACHPRLVQDILATQPKVIVPMGNPALTSLLGLNKITKVRGSVLGSTEFPDIYFVPTLHPASVLRRYDDEKILEHDLEVALRICREGFTRREVDYRVCRSVEEVEKLLQRLEMSTTDYVSVDTETTGFSPWDDKIICVSLTNRECTGWLIPIYGHHMAEIWSAEDLLRIIAALKKFLEGPTPKCGQNLIQFDHLMFRGNWGIELNNVVVDTMYLHHVVDENMPHGLDFIGTWYTDIDQYKDAFLKSIPRGGNYSDAPPEQLWEYACGDSDSTYRSAHRLVDAAREDDVLETHDRIMIPLAWVLADAEWHGIRVNEEELDRMHEEYQGKRETIEDRIFEIASGKFNLNSHKQRAKVLYDKLGLPVLKETAAGNRSTDVEVLKKLSKDFEIAELMLSLSPIDHDIKSYLKGKDGKSGMLKFMRNGRVHPGWLQHTAVTGRLASVDPNIQAIKKEKKGPFRTLFCATPGWVWMSFDYKSMEAYVAGYVAPDERLMEMHKNGEDVHRLVASQMFKCLPEEVTYAQRDQAKGVVFGLNYGRGEWSLAREFGITVEEAQQYMADYFILFQGVKRHFDHTKQMVDGPACVQTPFKRKRHFYTVANLKAAKRRGFFSGMAAKDAKKALGESYRQAQNMTIQSPASDMLGLACIRIHARFKKYGLLGQLLISQHDAHHSECPEEELEDSASIIKEELERPVPEMHNASFEVDAKIGRYWGDKSISVKGITDYEL